MSQEIKARQHPTVFLPRMIRPQVPKRTRKDNLATLRNAAGYQWDLCASEQVPSYFIHLDLLELYFSNHFSLCCFEPL